MKYDFSGWATRNDKLCSDGRVIKRDAFKEQDGVVVPLVWNHQHNEPEEVLGHALLENRPDGVYAYGVFNDTEKGRLAKELVHHKDVVSLSIYANGLKHNGRDVVHGTIREVSLVLAGANPGAYIDTVVSHSDSGEEEGTIYTGEEIDVLSHAEEEEPDEKAEEKKEEKKEMPENEKTVKDVIDSMTEEQKNVMYFLVGKAVEDAKKGNVSDDEGEDNMKHNVFDGDYSDNNYLSHSEMTAVITDAKRLGSLKESVLQHGIEDTRVEFPTDVSPLLPDAHLMESHPEWVKRDTGWVTKVFNGAKHSPFSRLKSLYADITADEARAKGYLKGNLKTNEVFTLLKRTTAPTTVYKKQKMHRDDVVDIADFDVIAWIKGEMRMMLDEELARAVLIGDGRATASDDKIAEDCIRPIWTDEDFFTIKVSLGDVADFENADVRAKKFIRACIKARKDYKGSGSPTLFTTEDMLTDMLLLEDANGRVIYDSEAKLATALRVKEIVTVEPMENQTRKVDGVTHNLVAIIYNPADYTIGADKGGSVNLFDDFDIDYNAMKYLIETRCSGSLMKPYSAIAVEETNAAADADDDDDDEN